MSLITDFKRLNYYTNMYNMHSLLINVLGVHEQSPTTFD